MAAAMQPVALLKPVREMREAVLGSDQLSQVRPAVGTDIYSRALPVAQGWPASKRMTGSEPASRAALSELKLMNGNGKLRPDPAGRPRLSRMTAV
jgi:hypothetical protein